MKFKSLRLDHHGHAATLTFAQPGKRNAMTVAMGEEVARACDVLKSRKDLRAVVVTGEGSAFSAGGDLDFLLEVRGLPREQRVAEMLAFYRRYLSILEVPVPVIAAINGPAIGAGMCFAIACDLRVAASRARMGFTFVRLGLHPGMGATHFLPHLIGPARAADLLFTGRVISAEAAMAMGLVNAVHPSETLMDHALGLAEDIASNGPLAVRRVKASLGAVRRMGLDEALAREAEAQALDYGTGDLLEGVAAVREKRAPNFRGA